jgi:hypothetical protein
LNVLLVINEMIDLVSDMPAVPIRGRIFVSAMIRANSRFKRFLYFVPSGNQQASVSLHGVTSCQSYYNEKSDKSVLDHIPGRVNYSI